jgi:hypothetical protein
VVVVIVFWELIVLVAMASQHISEGLKKFIIEQVSSVFRLEILLLLHRTQSRSFTAAEVVQELCFEADVAQEQLSELVATGLLVQFETDEFHYRYDPIDQAQGAMVEELAVGYSTQRVPILSLLLASHPDRARIFAEAFRLIREP